MGDHIRGSTPGAGNLYQYITSHPGQLSLAIPPWAGVMSTSQRAVMSCGLEVKAGMVRVWVAGKTVISELTQAISGCFRDEVMRFFIIRRYTNRPYFSLPFYKIESEVAWARLSSAKLPVAQQKCFGGPNAVGPSKIDYRYCKCLRVLTVKRAVYYRDYNLTKS